MDSGMRWSPDTASIRRGCRGTGGAAGQALGDDPGEGRAGLSRLTSSLMSRSALSGRPCMGSSPSISAA